MSNNLGSVMHLSSCCFAAHTAADRIAAPAAAQTAVPAAPRAAVAILAGR